MSWLFSQALAEVVSAESYWDGEPFAQLNVMPTQQQFWHNGKMIDCSRLSQFGPTLRLLTAANGADMSMWYRGVFRAKTSARPDVVPDWTESEADSGWKWPASFAKFDHASSSWKTRQCSLLGDLDEFSGTWPKWGSMRNGECLARTTPELYTSEKDFGFWPTVRASDGERGGRGDLIQAVRGNQNSHFKAYPTPTASNTKAHHIRGADKGKARSYGARGPLNPEWIEWLMGWPARWTELGALETDKFHEWSRQHGESLAANDEDAGIPDLTLDPETIDFMARVLGA